MAKHDESAAIQLRVSRNGQETSEERLVRTFNELKDELISTLIKSIPPISNTRPGRRMTVSNVRTLTSVRYRTDNELY